MGAEIAGAFAFEAGQRLLAKEKRALAGNEKVDLMTSFRAVAATRKPSAALVGLSGPVSCEDDIPRPA